MKESLRKALAGREKRTIIDCKLKESAVLVPLFLKDGKYHIIFTKRTEHLSRHSGQISFPGGARHDDDKSLLETALRETFEEIGVKQSDVEILGELDDTATLSYFCITPFVGIVPYPYEYKQDLYEVEEIFDVSLEDLMNTRRKEETRVIGEKPFKVYSYEVNGRVIWGATAWILTGLLDIICNSSGARCNN
jgi:8-oxo-dGTP pyrophosphatase MutT (NUDIX family)